MAAGAGRGCSFAGDVLRLAEGELPAERKDEIHAHLEGCGACRTLFSELTAGQFPKLANYVILEQIGKGGFGLVYKAIHVEKERVEAVKVLFGKTPLITSYFENEVHAIARLRHPHIATLYEAHLTEPPLYYAMEFVAGRRLNEYLREQAPTLGQRLELVKKVTEAVGYAHEQGVIHRDIKPQNILVDAGGAPHIVDFGIAKKVALAGVTDRAATEGPVGTLGYIAPEQADSGVVDGRADVFSLGALLFHCVTGEPAREATNGGRVRELLRSKRFAQPDDLAAIIARCVARWPEDRYASCAELSADVENYLNGRPIRANRGRSVVRQSGRQAALMLREFPVAAFALSVFALFLFLTWFFNGLETRKQVTPIEGPEVALIAYRQSTEQSLEEGVLREITPEVSIYDPMSVRMLLGRMLERLAIADPRVVVLDVFMPQCDAEYDRVFVSGVEALEAAGTPTVVGVASVYPSGAPEICPTVREAVHSYGTIVTTHTETRTNEFEVPFYVERRLHPLPVPTLSMAAFAAIQGLHTRGEVSSQGNKVRVAYRKRDVEFGEDPYLEHVDQFEVHRERQIDRPWTFQLSGGRNATALREGDRVAFFRVRAHRPGFWEDRTTTIEDVMTASDEQLRKWFSGKAVVFGFMTPGRDQFPDPTNSQQSIYGVQIHAEALQSLLTRARMVVAMDWLSIAWRVLGGVLAGLLVALVSPVGFGQGAPRRLIGGALTLAVLVASAYVAVRVTTPWVVELFVTGSAFLISFMTCYSLQIMRARQLHASPQEFPVTSDSDLPSTIIAASH